MTEVPVLSRSEHDRIAHRRGDEDWIDEQWATVTSRAFTLSANGKVAVQDNALVLTAPGDLAGLRVLLGSHAGHTYFGVLAEQDVSQPGWATLRESAVALSALDSGLLTAAVALQEWHRSHTHCPRCGTGTEPVQAGWARRCPQDGSQHFPRTDPAVIMLVTDDTGRCLLGRATAWPAGRFSTLAGFVEAGESAEAAVAREVAEEVGVTVTDIRYVASQPHPFPGSLMLGFTARLDGDPAITIDDDEIAEAGWFTRDEVRQAVEWDSTDTLAADVVLRALPPTMSIARQLIRTWLG